MPAARSQQDAGHRGRRLRSRVARLAGATRIACRHGLRSSAQRRVQWRVAALVATRAAGDDDAVEWRLIQKTTRARWAKRWLALACHFMSYDSVQMAPLQQKGTRRGRIILVRHVFVCWCCGGGATAGSPQSRRPGTVDCVIYHKLQNEAMQVDQCNDGCWHGYIDMSCSRTLPCQFDSVTSTGPGLQTHHWFSQAGDVAVKQLLIVGDSALHHRPHRHASVNHRARISRPNLQLKHTIRPRQLLRERTRSQKSAIY